MRRNNLALFGIILTSLIGFVFIVSALTDDEKTALQQELTSLENSLTNSGYEWLINYNLTYPSVNVYREGSNELLTAFTNITGNGFNKYQIFLTNLGENDSYATFKGITSGENDSFSKYQVFLTNLAENESYDVFDLRSVGDVERVPREILVKKLRIDEIRKELNTYRVKNG